MRTNSTTALLAALPLLAAAAPQPVRLRPATSWVLDYAEDSCRLSRAFGTEADHTVLQFESTAPGELSMVAIGRPLQTGSEEIPAKFLPIQDKAFKGEPELTTSKQPAVLWSGISLLPAVLVERDKNQEDWRKAHPDIRPPSIKLRSETKIARRDRRLPLPRQRWRSMPGAVAR
jgi:hypothetical protein